MEDEMELAKNCKECLQHLIAMRELYHPSFDIIYSRGIAFLDEYRQGQSVNSLVDSLNPMHHLPS